ncbi:unnamed protein product, partial [Nippostrongylus brasiliensis]|uniref:Reverse transcriptase domain-containing protein n=1 Tax=Nippostrongylus brasiliensis TaxID=27835 RepID=A0A0N4XPS7_NIPBR
MTQHQAVMNLYGLSVSQVMTLLNECLQCNVFRWSCDYYKQVRGLAMGQRLAPVLAVTFMSKVESSVLQRMPTLYYRYIDDCFVVCPTQKDMDDCFAILNEQSEHISFAREKPTDSWLAFLNVHVQLTEGGFKTRWYRKPTSKIMIVHYSSAHPVAVKKAIVHNMFRTASMVSSHATQKHHSLCMARDIAKRNGYPCQERSIGSRRSAGADRPGEDRTKIAFPVPFISDGISHAIRTCLRKADLH